MRTYFGCELHYGDAHCRAKASGVRSVARAGPTDEVPEERRRDWMYPRPLPSWSSGTFSAAFFSIPRPATGSAESISAICSEVCGERTAERITYAFSLPGQLILPPGAWASL